MAKKKNSRIVPYRPPANINVGLIIFAIIFVYMSFSVYTYLKKVKIQFYEVVEGGIVNDHSCTGLILRDERVETADRAGYVHYYVRDGKRAAVGTKVYSIDETGSLESYLSENPDAAVSLTEDNLKDLKRQLSNFCQSFTDENFGSVYDVQTTLEAAVLEYANFNSLGYLESILQQTGASFVQVAAPVSGVVSYAIDGFEDMDVQDVKAGSFDRAGYTKAVTKSGQLVEKSAPVYKLITSDTWSLVFPIAGEDLAEYEDKTRLSVEIPSEDLEMDGSFSLITGADGASYGQLTFEKYMVPFVSDRYLDFEVETENVSGLKIPVTAVTEKTFFLLPADYITTGGDSSSAGFLREVYTENGTSVEFTPAEIYASEEDQCYVAMGDGSPFASGDYIVKPDSDSRFQLGATGTLRGVYNINKGYAVFKQVVELKSNSEYMIVEKGTSYGLSVYDHIVLDADTVYEGQLIYQ